MDTRIQGRHGVGRGKEAAATFAVAGAGAIALALGTEGVALLLGALAGQAGAHRGWLDTLLLGQPLPGALLRELALLTAAAFPLCLLPARRIGPTLLARYDAAALRVDPPAAPAPASAWTGPRSPAQQAAWAGLERWCQAAGPAASAPFWQPLAAAELAQPLKVAVLTGGSVAERSQLALAFSRHIDGTVRLRALEGKLRRIAWRLRIKLDECLWWRPLPPDTPWDAGYLPARATDLAHLHAFRPRRATLIVADGLHPRLLSQALRMLEQHCAEFRHPVRVLVVDAAQPAEDRLRGVRQAAQPCAQVRGQVPVFELDTV
ncbi:hypothetical protein [Azohydromonas caseinilytica]|uniref:Uncharacterized protein n=1 Tax=Azohydromonas caseinilytica TaxID=2728836 RepID=A0A848FA98_9BURK|nr:hypothetical protein [Azohydromonas caseinilytica]NML17087.1 hypothetical protein [Azohydromonas caseinilytica]